MNGQFDVVITAMFIGGGATLVMDVWGLLAARLFGFPRPDYALVGRWVGHIPRGQFLHERIAQSPAVAGERLLGWATHYVTGVMLAAILLMFAGPAWARHPTPAPALVVGLLTLAAPFLLMQPGMGAGIASARTANPNRARLRSLLNHVVFGFGLYGAAHFVNAIA